jgi:hypothetical protein
MKCDHTSGFNGRPVTDYVSPVKLQGHVRFRFACPLHQRRGFSERIAKLTLPFQSFWHVFYRVVGKRQVLFLKARGFVFRLLLEGIKRMKHRRISIFLIH